MIYRNENEYYRQKYILVVLGDSFHYCLLKSSALDSLLVAVQQTTQSRKAAKPQSHKGAVVLSFLLNGG
jgi:hypothetical protein